ncbi:ThiF family adenylyltransferase [Chryseobacterium culicis]|uniref:ThiF family protein n=1 Tax=Chryseobacterium culicis TaxID=680127 RepID=A0A1H6HNL2_CHRCI|nr:ThiF family adenylyltransferase [Chryseobacterium culicis]MBE4950566.1 ThiF family adenylyltransferase [Chryseobacterium culicis]SEH35775.1 ThiF family protein [Chryseobacterium culicis]
METKYSRNRLYVQQEEQQTIKDFSILLAGSGIGSNIAECALRFGFENITIVDGDTIEQSNLNRQNYTHQDISSYKAETLYHRLKSINPDANIRYRSEFITPDNVHEIIGDHDIAINALDFSSNIPVVFDKICQERGIHVLHPYNLGWGGLVAVLEPGGLPLDILSDENFNELKMVEYIAGYLRFWRTPNEWLENIIDDYKKEKENLPPPQLAIASWIVAGMCTHVMFKIATGKPYKTFPQFYMNAISE